MIVDFTVSNYRSIKEPVTLSFVAQKGRASKGDKNSTTPSDESICPGYEVKGRDFKLLPVAAVFGANASGKSNVIRALDELIGLMSFGPHSKDSLFDDFVPFRLQYGLHRAPTELQAQFAVEESLYTFQLSIREGQILSERLDYSPPPTKRQSTRLLYSRSLNEATGEYEFSYGESFSGAHLQLIDKLETYQPYISLLHKLRLPITEPLSSWLQLAGLGYSHGYEDINENFAASTLYNNVSRRNWAIDILKAFDTGLSDIVIKKSESDTSGRSKMRLYASKLTSDGTNIEWAFKEESLGTQRLFTFLAQTLASLEYGSAYIVDELGANFHPKITREIIKLFHSPETNPHGAQLIFTSHDNTLWRGVLRRDEIWLTEKKADQSTQLVPLSAYKPRTDLAMDKAYLDGRFGGVPLIGDVSEVFEKVTEEKSIEEKELADVA